MFHARISSRLRGYRSTQSLVDCFSFRTSLNIESNIHLIAHNFVSRFVRMLKMQQYLQMYLHHLVWLPTSLQHRHRN